MPACESVRCRLFIFDSINRGLARRFIRDFDETGNKQVRIRYGMFAGWFSIVVTSILFIIRITLGVMAGSISVIANAFHVLSHLANSIILVVTFVVTGKPATAKNPFGHGRMEHIAPLIMSIVLFVSGFQMAETSVHQILNPHKVNYWPALPWILLATIVVKQWLSSLVGYLGTRVESRVIRANAAHHNLEAVMTGAVIAGLVAGHHFHHPEIDGYIGVAVSAWLLFLGFRNGRDAIVPLLGQAPGKDIIERIRSTARSVDGVEDVHEIIVHDYGSMYLISLHAEIPETLGPARMHEIAERCENALGRVFGGIAVCHTDPLMERTPEIQALEDLFSSLLSRLDTVEAYHDFRVIAESAEKIIIAADLDVAEGVDESDHEHIVKNLEHMVLETIPGVAYCSFYITPRFAY